MQQWELCEGRAGALKVGLNHGSSRRSSSRSGPGVFRCTAVCASISANATAQIVLPAAAAAVGPASLAALAQDAHHGLLLAAAAARTLLVPRDGSVATPQRWRRAKPAPKLPAPGSRRLPAGDMAAPTIAQPARAASVAGSTSSSTGSAAMQHQIRAAQQFLAGGIAGAVSKTLVAPLERVSTLLMTPTANQRFNLAQATQHAWRDGPYRGHAATLVKIFPASAIQFAVFNSLKDRILTARQRQQQQPQQHVRPQEHNPQQQPELSIVERLIAGAAAGAAAACCCYPLESTRTAMSVAGGVRGSLLEVARSVVVVHGPAALYRGFQASLVGDVLGNALGFTAYEMGNRLYRDICGGTPAPPHMRGVIGACSAACVLTLTMPLEVVRRRLQVQGLAGRPVLYRGTLDCLRQVLRKEGLAGFYSASIPSYLKVAPSIGCMYFCFELLMSAMPPAPSTALLAPAAPAAATTTPGHTPYKQP